MTKPPDLTVRPGTPVDWPEVRAIEVAAGEMFRSLGRDDVADDDPPSDDDLEQAVEVLVGVDDSGELVGYARLDLIDEHAHLAQLSVRPEHGRKGIGTTLLNAVAEWATARDDGQITLTTFRDVPFNAPFYVTRQYEVVPEAEWTDELRALVAAEAADGLDPATRVVMRRSLT